MGSGSLFLYLDLGSQVASHSRVSSREKESIGQKVRNRLFVCWPWLAQRMGGDCIGGDPVGLGSGLTTRSNEAFSCWSLMFLSVK